MKYAYLFFTLFFVNALVIAQPPGYQSVKAEIFRKAPVILECMPLHNTTRVYYDKAKKVAYYASDFVQACYLRGSGPQDTVTIIHAIDNSYVPAFNLGLEEHPLPIKRGRYNNEDGSDLPCPGIKAGLISVLFCKPMDAELKAELGINNTWIIYDLRYPGLVYDQAMKGCGEMKYESQAALYKDISRYGKIRRCR